MDVESYRKLQFLTEISSGDSVTQRRLAKKHGLALGLTNFLIRRLIKKGYVKIVNLERKRLRYLITPYGVAEKARLTYEYLDYSLALYRHVRAFLTQTLSTIVTSGIQRVALYGMGELAEIAFLLMQQRGLTIVAVVDDSAPDGSVFMGHPVQPLTALAKVACDCVVIASFADREPLLQRMREVGIPKERILALSDHGQLSSALPPSATRALPVSPSISQEVLTS